jgi:type IV secretory pathway VirD2 relaxase
MPKETALVMAYRNAQTKSLKSTILSIYASHYTSQELKQMHVHFEKLSEPQIARAQTVSIGLEQVVSKGGQHNAETSGRPQVECGPIKLV